MLTAFSIFVMFALGGVYMYNRSQQSAGASEQQRLDLATDAAISDAEAKSDVNAPTLDQVKQDLKDGKA